MRLSPEILLGLAAQVPLSSHNQANRQQDALNDDSPVSSTRAFTPKDLVEQPSVGTAIVNPSGNLLFVPYSKWSLDTNTESHSLRIHSLDALSPRDVLHEISLPVVGEAFWYDDITLVAALPNATDRTTSLYASYLSQDALSEEVVTTLSGVGELVGVLPTDTAAYFRYSAASRALVFTARVFPDGNLTTAVKQEREWKGRPNTARAYDGRSYTRFWNEYGDPMHSSLFSVPLSVRRGKWQLGDLHVNLLNGTAHKVPAEDSLDPGNDFDVSASQVVYTTKDPELSEAFHTKRDASSRPTSFACAADVEQVYLVDIHGRSPTRELTAGAHGETSNPVFSPDGKLIAWLESSQDGAFAQKNFVVVYNTQTDARLEILQDWDRSPSSIAFSPDSTSLYLTAPEMARVKVFYYPLYDNASKTAAPVTLTRDGEALGLQPLPNGRLIYTHRTLTNPGNVVLLSNIQAPVDPYAIESHEITQLLPPVLSAPHVFSGMEDFWFDGDARKIHGYVLKPRGWTPDAAKKDWPVVLFIHGGPQLMSGDAWNVPFNPQVYSQQGYFVVAINPTGSISFGQEYADAVIGDWGGAPLRDITKGFKHALKEYPEIDPKRAFAVGFSYGGYMINLLQGHARELDLEFAAFANMGGPFNAEYFAYTIDQLFLMHYSWLGWPWENKTQSIYNAFSPQRFVQNWETPQLNIHGDADFRVPVTDGIATFNALQQRGVPSRLVIFDEEPHVFGNPHNIVIYHEAIFEWFERFARGKNDTSAA
ncbi:alpha/beta-hydrolase [Peniophora sp. CONT]|nr:alpha/beta-hydrolase [Peniophora sp. CONT]